MPFSIICGDIAAFPADAVVNAANSALAPGGGVCGAIFRAAGYDRMERACRAIGHCEVGQAVLTEGFALPARYVIHAVGPIWRGGGQNEEALLKSCYTVSLHLAKAHGLASVAFPLISSGIYGYPKREALRAAVNAISAFLLENEMEVTLVVFDRDAVQLSEQLAGRIQAYINDHYADSRRSSRTEARILRFEEQAAAPLMAASLPAALPPRKRRRSLQDLLDHLDESFSRTLLRLIDEKGMNDVEVYKRANIDRKLFSRLRREDYRPGKQTVIALSIAMRLNLDETRDLLGRAGYALSHSRQFDVIIEYFITEGIYDIYEINEALFAFDQRLLGA